MNNELQQASTMDATLRGNILIAEFEGKKFYPRLNEHSYANNFETYAACEAFIKQVDIGKYGYVPSLGGEFGCGKYNKEWNWLIPAWNKFRTQVITKWYHPSRDKVEAEIKQFEIWEHNFYDGVGASCVQCSFEIMVGALTWFNFLNKKEAGNETTE